MNLGELPTLLSRSIILEECNGSNMPQKQGPVAIETLPLMQRHLRQTSIGDEQKKAHCNVQRAFFENTI